LAEENKEDPHLAQWQEQITTIRDKYSASASVGPQSLRISALRSRTLSNARSDRDYDRTIGHYPEKKDIAISKAGRK